MKRMEVEIQLAERIIRELKAEIKKSIKEREDLERREKSLGRKLEKGSQKVACM